MFSNRYPSYNEQTQNMKKSLRTNGPISLNYKEKDDGEPVTKIKATYMGLNGTNQF